MKANLFFARFPYGNSENPDATDWLIQTALKVKRDARVDQVHQGRYDDTPITMTRNKAVEDAKKMGADYLVMLDSDMAPDLALPGAKPFWDTSFDWMWERRSKTPCMIAAPYVGPPPYCNVYVFQWVNFMNQCSNPDWKLEMYTREHAAQMQGIQEAAALPTGLILIDMRVFAKLKPPYFYYEWKDATQSEKASTEDVAFTRDCSLQGMPVYCNWDAWAGHHKRYCAPKPMPICVDHIRDKFVEAVQNNIRSNQRFVYVEPALDLDSRPFAVVDDPEADLAPNIANIANIDRAQLEAVGRHHFKSNLAARQEA